MVGIIPEQAQNEVHEWGVVVFEQNASLMCGDSWQSIDYYPDYFSNNDLCAEAPVVWIHGSSFDRATFTVNTDAENITLYYPNVDSISLNHIEWQILPVETTFVQEETEIYNGPFYWAMDSWRKVNSLVLQFQKQERTENFLYYECTINSNFTDNFFNWSSDGYPVFENSEIPNALYFCPNGVFEFSRLEGKVLPLNLLWSGCSLSEEDIVNTFSSWGGSNFELSEIVALWETWEPILTSTESNWLIFPIPSEYYNSISTISLEIEPSRTVIYNRLYLGIVEIKK